MKYTRKQTVVDVFQWKGYSKEHVKEFEEFANDRRSWGLMDDVLYLYLPFGPLCIAKGDYIVKDMDGKLYPYKAELFEMIFEAFQEGEKEEYPFKVKVGHNSEVHSKSIRDYDSFLDGVSLEAVKNFWDELRKRNTMDERIVCVASGDEIIKEMEAMS